MKNYIANGSIEVPDIALLFLCKTATKKTLELIEMSEKDIQVYLDCEIDEEIQQCFHVNFDNIKEAKEFEKNCIEALNY